MNPSLLIGAVCCVLGGMVLGSVVPPGAWQLPVGCIALVAGTAFILKGLLTGVGPMTLFLVFLCGGTVGVLITALCVAAGKEESRQYTTGEHAKWSGWPKS